MVRNCKFRTAGDAYWFKRISPQHLQRYCDEFAHRYNTRLQPIDTRFAESVKQFGAARLKYRELTPDQREPHRKARYTKKAIE